MTQSEAVRSEAKASPIDWLLLFALIAIGGSSFAMIQEAIATIPPVIVTIGRLWIGAAITLAIMVWKKRRLPPLLKRGGLAPEWGSLIIIAVIGYVLPFFIFPWAQQYVESGLAGVYMAFMPLWTLGLAYLFADEALSRNKIIGFLLGFAGVIILMGPDAVSSAAGADLLPQLSLLAATLFYAISAVIVRRAPPMPPSVLTAGSIFAAAIIATPAGLIATWQPGSASPSSMINVFLLGIGPTGLAGILLVTLIRRIGASFMALANYLTPLWAVATGAILFGERLELAAFIALGVILLGVAISQKSATRP